MIAQNICTNSKFSWTDSSLRSLARAQAMLVFRVLNGPQDHFRIQSKIQYEYLL